MLQQLDLTVKSNVQLNATVYEMVLHGHFEKQQCGQFLEMKVGSNALRRPFSIAYATDKNITVLYRVVGGGTREMTELSSGATVNCLVGLGNSFDITKAKKPLLIGGGIGNAPLYYLAKTFNEQGITPLMICGFKNKDDAFYLKEFNKVAKVIVATDDGSLGFKGNALGCLRSLNPDFDYYYACGPYVMLKNLTEYVFNGEISLEERMGCGFGMCMGCSIKTKSGAKRVCKEGPVFDAGEVIW